MRALLLGVALSVGAGMPLRAQTATEDALLAWWRSSAQPPVEYVLARFDRANWVFLGEYHRIRDDVRLVADLIPALHARSRVRDLALESLCHTRSDAANELITAAVWDRGAAIDFLRDQDPSWPYEEYLELYRIAWESNRIHAGERGVFRFVGLHPCIDWEVINYSDDPEAVERERDKQRRYDEIMAAELEAHLLAADRPALVFTGIAHATARFSEYRHGTDQRLVRMGNMVRREPWVDRMFFIALHAPFWDAATDREILPFDGVLDRAMLAYRSPVGFDVGGSPVEGLEHRNRSERTITAYTFGELYDGFIMHATPLKEAMGVTCISDWIETAEEFRHFWRNLPNREASERFSRVSLAEFRRDFCAPRADHGLLFRNRFRRLPDAEAIGSFDARTILQSHLSHGIGASPFDSPLVHDATAAEMIVNARGCASQAAIRGLASDATRARILVDQLTEAGILRIRGDQLCTAFPILVGEERAAYTRITGNATRTMYGALGREFSALMRAVEERGWKPWQYHFLWSQLFDSQFAWTELMQRDLVPPLGELIAWIVHPAHPYRSGTNYFPDSELRDAWLLVSWRTGATGTIARIGAEWELLMAVGFEGREPSPEEHERLSRLDLVDGRGALDLPVLRPGDPLIDRLSTLAARYVDLLHQEVSLDSLMALTQADARTTFAMAYHDVSWGIVETMVRSGEIVVPLGLRPSTDDEGRGSMRGSAAILPAHPPFIELIRNAILNHR